MSVKLITSISNVSINQIPPKISISCARALSFALFHRVRAMASARVCKQRYTLHSILVHFFLNFRLVHRIIRIELPKRSMPAFRNAPHLQSAVRFVRFAFCVCVCAKRRSRVAESMRQVAVSGNEKSILTRCPCTH